MIFKKLKEAGILGINRRVGEYILPYNPRRYYPDVDNKIKTFHLAEKFNISQPKIFTTIETTGELRFLHKKIHNLQEFVIKPNRGAMGNGILLIHSANWPQELNSSKRKDFDKIVSFETSRGSMNLKDLTYYISDILSGMYYLNGQPDQVILQEKLGIHPTLIPYAYKGIPDVRVIVFRGYPVMAMIRLPTSQSKGRANLHQGAVGCGLNIKDGTICGATWQNSWIHHHPDTKNSFSNLQIPHWHEVLELSSRCYKLTNMGYIGVDLVLDEQKGPLLLEINARPGLSIQIANKTGLEPRLKFVKSLPEDFSPREKVELIKRHSLFS